MPFGQYRNTKGDILIIDDTPANLQLLSSILEERGHKVRAVVSGTMGLVAARAITPDIILLDIKMPDIDGYQVCEQLKASEHLRQIPVIFISSADETIDKIRAFQLGAVDYVTKPFQVEEVIARVESQLMLYRFYQQSLELAALQERQRLARDLHDAVSQTLFSISIIAESAIFQYQEYPEQLEGSLQQIHQLSQSALLELRILLFELRPEILAKVRLGELLRQLAEVYSKRTNADITLSAEPELSLPQEVHLVFYRIAQESLNNIAKYAHATHIEISLYQNGADVVLMIRDNGRGFDIADMPASHFGLGNMRERADSIAAHFQIESYPNQGTIVDLRWASGV